MSATPEVRYTDAGKAALERAKERYVTRLERQIIESRYAPGDDVVEITAADVERAQGQLILLPRTRSGTLELTASLYFLLGVSLTAFGFFYTRLRQILNENPFQAGAILVGILMMLFSGLFLVMVRTRRVRFRELHISDADVIFPRPQGPSARITIGSPPDLQVFSPKQLKKEFGDLNSVEREELSRKRFAGRHFAADLLVWDVTLRGNRLDLVAKTEREDYEDVIVFADFEAGSGEHLRRLRKNAKIHVEGEVTKVDATSISLDKATVTPFE